MSQLFTVQLSKQQMGFIQYFLPKGCSFAKSAKKKIGSFFTGLTDRILPQAQKQPKKTTFHLQNYQGDTYFENKLEICERFINQKNLLKQAKKKVKFSQPKEKSIEKNADSQKVFKEKTESTKSEISKIQTKPKQNSCLQQIDRQSEFKKQKFKHQKEKSLESSEDQQKNSKKKVDPINSSGQDNQIQKKIEEKDFEKQSQVHKKKQFKYSYNDRLRIISRIRQLDKKLMAEFFASIKFKKGETLDFKILEDKKINEIIIQLSIFQEISSVNARKYRSSSEKNALFDFQRVEDKDSED